MEKCRWITMEDLISIIMPSYNTGEFIAESVQSVVKQTYENWELIIVDDCSTDNTDQVLQPYLADKRIRYLKNDKNFGAAISRNRAIKEAKGRYIAFLDSDDLWEAGETRTAVGLYERTSLWIYLYRLSNTT